MNDPNYSIEDLELEYEGSQDFFRDYDETSHKKLDKNDQNLAKSHEHPTELCATTDSYSKVGDHGVPDDYKQPRSNNHGHIFQEMAIVKRRIDFDEQAFREECHLKSVELSQKFKGNACD